MEVTFFSNYCQEFGVFEKCRVARYHNLDTFLKSSLTNIVCFLRIISLLLVRTHTWNVLETGLAHQTEKRPRQQQCFGIIMEERRNEKRGGHDYENSKKEAPVSP